MTRAAAFQVERDAEAAGQVVGGAERQDAERQPDLQQAGDGAVQRAVAAADHHPVDIAAGGAGQDRLGAGHALPARRRRRPCRPASSSAARAASAASAPLRAWRLTISRAWPPCIAAALVASEMGRPPTAVARMQPPRRAHGLRPDQQEDRPPHGPRRPFPCRPPLPRRLLRLAAGQAVPLLALAVCAAGLLGFALLADMLEDGEHRFDEALLLALRQPGDAAQPIGPPWLALAMRDLTALGGIPVLGLLRAGRARLPAAGPAGPGGAAAAGLAAGRAAAEHRC